MLCENVGADYLDTLDYNLNPCSNERCSARGYRCPQRDYVPAVLILVLMEDALRELNLRRAECQSVTVPFLENPLDFRGKSVPNRSQIYEFSKLCITLSERSHEQSASSNARHAVATKKRMIP